MIIKEREIAVLKREMAIAEREQKQAEREQQFYQKQQEFALMQATYQQMQYVKSASIDFLQRDEELCIRCGWCAGVCPEGAVEVKKPFEGTIVVDQDACQNCGACVDVCECNALAFPVSDAPGSRLDQIIANADYCIKCGGCAKVCPNGAITVTRTKINNTPTNSITWNKAIDAIKN